MSDVNVPKKHGAEIVGDKTAVLENKSETETMDVLLLQGRPIGEPVASHGPFVMNTRQEIMQCFELHTFPRPPQKYRLDITFRSK